MRHSVSALPQVFVTTSTEVRDVCRRSRAAAAGKQNRLIRTCTVAGRWSSLISCASSLQARVTTSEQSTVNDCHTGSCHSTVARFRRGVRLLYAVESKVCEIEFCNWPAIDNPKGRTSASQNKGSNIVIVNQPHSTVLYAVHFQSSIICSMVNQSTSSVCQAVQLLMQFSLVVLYAVHCQKTF